MKKKMLQDKFLFVYFGILLLFFCMFSEKMN